MTPVILAVLLLVALYLWLTRKQWLKPSQKRPPHAIRRPPKPKAPESSHMVQSGAMTYLCKGTPKDPPRPKPPPPVVKAPKPKPEPTKLPPPAPKPKASEPSHIVQSGAMTYISRKKPKPPARPKPKSPWLRKPKPQSESPIKKPRNPPRPKPKASEPSHIVQSGAMTYISRKKPKPPPRPKPKSPWLRKPKPPPGVPARLTHQLETLTRDKATAQRLVDQVATAHPGKSRTWCTEKAIADLLRDRRR